MAWCPGLPRGLQNLAHDVRAADRAEAVHLVRVGLVSDALQAVPALIHDLREQQVALLHAVLPNAVQDGGLALAILDAVQLVAGPLLHVYESATDPLALALFAADPVEVGLALVREGVVAVGDVIPVVDLRRGGLGGIGLGLLVQPRNDLAA